MHAKNTPFNWQGRIILLTGASRGLGKALALQCAYQGAHVIACARTKGALISLDDEIAQNPALNRPTLVPIDLSQPDGIDQLAQTIYTRFGRLDGLISAAGILGEISPIPHIDIKTFAKIIAVNLTANYRLIRAFDGILRATTNGRALFIGSSAARSRKAFWGAYAASKAGLETLVQCYAQEIEYSTLRVNIIYPGAMRTHMRAKAMPGEDQSTLTSPQDIAQKCLPLLDISCTQNGEIVDLASTK